MFLFYLNTGVYRDIIYTNSSLNYVNTVPTFYNTPRARFLKTFLSLVVILNFVNENGCQGD